MINTVHGIQIWNYLKVGNDIKKEIVQVNSITKKKIGYHKVDREEYCYLTNVDYIPLTSSFLDYMVSKNIISEYAELKESRNLFCISPNDNTMNLYNLRYLHEFQNYIKSDIDENSLLLL